MCGTEDSYALKREGINPDMYALYVPERGLSSLNLVYQNANSFSENYRRGRRED